MPTLSLPYGSTRYPLAISPATRVLMPVSLPPPTRTPRALVEAALDAPIGCAPLEHRVRRGARVLVIVSDATRHEPRTDVLAAVLARLATVGAHVTVAVATGTHGRCPASAFADINPDGDPADYVDLGTTARGTPIRIHRSVVGSDLVVATGCIRPHYFAGFAGGVKAVFPGLGEPAAVRVNHRWKTDPRSCAGALDDNPCRLDLEELVARLPTPTFLVNTVAGPDDATRAAVAGDIVVAHRAGCEIARPWFAARAAPAPHVIASDALPVTATLYQAAKIAAAVAPLVAANGRLTLVAECAAGIGPGGFAVVNEAIFRIGVLPRLRAGVELQLVSAMPASDVRQTLLAPADAVFAEADSLVVPVASQLICEVL